ncbi:ABC transporter permease [Georgenia ruanii]|uniref:ABC transporter permease subunit n=1 Tax=Georgenia ruanii TaxID=348442 RepID=A0A7J9UTF7_9MICO|nr:ABC transporter permease subunit [Georgenia ruanii]MPV87160.1 ABC transporter permease subunit [Georgenia ruanii]
MSAADAGTPDAGPADAVAITALAGTAGSARAAGGTRAGVRAVAYGLLGVLVLAAVWELYKLLGPADGWSLAGARVLPRTTDLAMPHVWEMATELGTPLSSATGAPALAVAVLRACGLSFAIALLSWAIGVVVGFFLALAMQRVRIAESAFLPLVVLSQTVPLIALAPVVSSWGSRIRVGPWEWDAWMSVAVIAAYLAFFPVAVGALRGLQSPDAIHTDLMRSYGAGWWQTLGRLRLPASVPYLLPALRLAGANAVVGTVVAEVSTGLPGGVGRMIVEFANFASSAPARPWAPLLGAVLLGLVTAGIVAALGVALRRFRRTEVPA